MIATNIAEAAVSMAEAQAYARVETGEEEALLAGLVRSASALCESFIGQVLIARPFEETLLIARQWQRLSLTPVRTIEAVTAVAADGGSTALAAGEYEVDIDSRGDGWVRVLEVPGRHGGPAPSRVCDQRFGPLAANRRADRRPVPFRTDSLRAGGTIGPRIVPAVEAVARTARDRVGSAHPCCRRAILHDRSGGDQFGRNGG